MRFYTAINCMDGRVQLPVIHYLTHRFNVDVVDTITEAGPAMLLSHQREDVRCESVFERVRISTEIHNSVGIAIIGHHDCAADTSPKPEKIRHVRESVVVLAEAFPEHEIIGLYVDSEWTVHDIARM